MYTLIEELKKVKDFRKEQGKRHPLWLILLLVILGIMQGYIGYRAIGDFVKSNQESLVNKLNISPNRVPSYSTIRRVMMGVDWALLNQIFNQWAGQLNKINQEEDWIAIDGKSLRNTVKNYNTNCQNFRVILSAYSLNNGIVIRGERWENKKSSEIKQVQDLVRNCGLKNQVFTLDAKQLPKRNYSINYIFRQSLSNCRQRKSKKIISENPRCYHSTRAALDSPF